MNEDKITDLLKDEYLQIQHHIETIDERVISIKNWSVSVSMAGIATAFVSHNAIILLLSCLSSLIFLSVEGLWKTFQSAFFPRADEIEKHFRNEIQEIKPMQIGISANLTWKVNPIKQFRSMIKKPHVYLPHLPIIVVGAILYVFCQFNIIKI